MEKLFQIIDGHSGPVQRRHYVLKDRTRADDDDADGDGDDDGDDAADDDDDDDGDADAAAASHDEGDDDADGAFDERGGADDADDADHPPSSPPVFVGRREARQGARAGGPRRHRPVADCR